MRLLESYLDNVEIVMWSFFYGTCKFSNINNLPRKIDKLVLFVT